MEPRLPSSLIWHASQAAQVGPIQLKNDGWSAFCLSLHVCLGISRDGVEGSGYRNDACDVKMEMRMSSGSNCTKFT